MILSLKNVSFAYPGQKNIINNVSFSIDKGSYISILGENGCGKSTLVKLILGLYKYSGSIECFTDRIGYVPQQKNSMFQLPVTVAELLHAAGEKIPQSNILGIDEVLDLVGVSHKKNALLGTLSGGQLQRVFIALALLGQPDLLILDELSTGVDTEGQARLYDMMQDFNQNRGITIISVEHNLPAAMHNSTQIFHLAEGQGHLCSPQQYAREYLHGAELSTEIEPKNKL